MPDPVQRLAVEHARRASAAHASIGWLVGAPVFLGAVGFIGAMVMASRPAGVAAAGAGARAAPGSPLAMLDAIASMSSSMLIALWLPFVVGAVMFAVAMGLGLRRAGPAAAGTLGAFGLSFVLWWPLGALVPGCGWAGLVHALATGLVMRGALGSRAMLVTPMAALVPAGLAWWGARNGLRAAGYNPADPWTMCAALMAAVTVWNTAECAAVYTWIRISRPHIGAAHTCQVCGYDLRGLRRGGVCPECATPIEKSRAMFIGRLIRQHHSIEDMRA